MYDSILSKPETDELAYAGADAAGDIAASAVIDGVSYPLNYWGYDGLSFRSPLRARFAFDDNPPPAYRSGDRVNMLLVFHLPDGAVEIPAQARVLRATNEDTVARFLPLPFLTSVQFERVMNRAPLH